MVAGLILQIDKVPAQTLVWRGGRDAARQAAMMDGDSRNECEGRSELLVGLTLLAPKGVLAGACSRIRHPAPSDRSGLCQGQSVTGGRPVEVRHQIARLSQMKRARRVWNGGSREAAMAASRQRTEEAIASGCERCPTCHGEGLTGAQTICPQCGAAGFLVPPGGMPLPAKIT